MPDAVTMTASQWRDRLVPMLDRQREMLGRLQQLADRQEALIRDGKVDALLSLLNERQKLIDGYLGMQRDLTPLLENLPAWLEKLSDCDRDRIRAAISEIDGQLDAVLKRDEDDRRLLEESRRGAREQLGTMASAKQARSAYLAPSTSSNNRFADQRG